MNKLTQQDLEYAYALGFDRGREAGVQEEGLRREVERRRFDGARNEAESIVAKAAKRPGRADGE